MSVLRALVSCLVLSVGAACSTVPPMPAPELPTAAPSAPMDGLEGVVGVLTAPRRCEGSLCAVAARTGPAPQGDLAGVRVGLALACRNGDAPGLGAPLEAASRGDWSKAELTGMSLDESGRMNVFAVRAETDAERVMVEDVRRQIARCFHRPKCELDVPAELMSALRRPEGSGREAHVDAHGHLVARSPGALTWHLGRSDARGGWLVVTEHRTGNGSGWCDWIDLYPEAPLGPSRDAPGQGREARRRER